MIDHPSHWLISTQKQDSDPSFSYPDRKTRTFFERLGTSRLSFAVFTVLFLFVFMAPVSVAHAGIFSFFENLFGGVVESKTYADLQDGSLLQAAVGTGFDSSVGGGDISIADGGTLLPGESSINVNDEDDPTPRSGQISLYVVREGDSLSQIAKMFGVNVNTIKWANDIGKNDVIHIGQTLTILPVSGVEYTVRSGDTIAGIAKKFAGDTAEIVTFNGLADEKSLTAGSTIIIPGGEIATAPVSSSKSRSSRSSSSRSGYSPVISYVTSPDYKGYYMRPIKGGIKTQGIHGYNAVDLAAPIGTPVFASAAGKVVVSKDNGAWNGGYGNYIVIEHGNKTETLYAHLSGTIVKRGWNVVQGQVIGYIGSTGHSTGPHLHFEIRGAVNPF